MLADGLTLGHDQILASGYDSTHTGVLHVGQQIVNVLTLLVFCLDGGVGGVVGLVTGGLAPFFLLASLLVRLEQYLYRLTSSTCHRPFSPLVVAFCFALTFPAALHSRIVLGQTPALRAASASVIT